MNSIVEQGNSKNKYPLPISDDLFDHLREENIFLKIYFISGYHQVSINEEYISFLFEVITEVSQSSLKGIGRKKMRLTNKMEEHINALTDAINEV